MKNISKNIKLILFLFTGITMTLFLSCEEDTKFEDYVPDYTYSIIRSFEANGQIATIDHTNGAITLTLEAGSDISSVAVGLTLPEGATVDPESGSTLDFSNGPVIFTISNKGIERKYTVTIAAFGDPMMMTFSIGENMGEINQTEGTISVSVGSVEDISQLVPQYTIPGGTTSSPASGIAQDFKEPVKFTVLSNDGFTGKSYVVTVTQLPKAQITSFKTGEDICGVTGIIDDELSTIKMIFPAGSDLSSISPIIDVTEGSTVSPESQVSQDFSTGAVDYVVTNVEGLTKTYSVTAESVASSNTVTFIGEADCINSLIDDDAKAAALFLQQAYPEDFNYIKFSNISATSLAASKVVMLYYLSPLPNMGFFATPDNVMTMLPVELQPGTDQSNALTTWVKAGGDIFLAGDPTAFIHVLGRMPADYTQPRGLGNYRYTEFGCAEPQGCVDEGKPADDIWGLGVRDSNNSTNRRNHPIFNGLEFVGDGELYLTNAATREVRLVWWQTMDGILAPGCCGQDAALLFEQTVNATKLGTLRWVGDAFGYGAVEFLGTNGVLDPGYDTNISTDFKGHVLTLENTIIGYEFGSNNTVNDYQSNIETLTTNIIDYLKSLNND